MLPYLSIDVMLPAQESRELVRSASRTNSSDRGGFACPPPPGRLLLAIGVAHGTNRRLLRMPLAGADCECGGRQGSLRTKIRRCAGRPSAQLYCSCFKGCTWEAVAFDSSNSGPSRLLSSSSHSLCAPFSRLSTVAYSRSDVGRVSAQQPAAARTWWCILRRL